MRNTEFVQTARARMQLQWYQDCICNGIKELAVRHVRLIACSLHCAGCCCGPRGALLAEDIRSTILQSAHIAVCIQECQSGMRSGQ